MLKILVTDRCHYDTGMGWLNHTDVLSSSLLVSGMNNLAKEHILQWKPIWLSLIYMVSSTMPRAAYQCIFCRLQDDAVGIVQSGEYASTRPQYASHAVLSKHTPLRELAQRIKGALYSSTAGSAGKRHAIALSAGGKVLRDVDGRHQQ